MLSTFRPDPVTLMLAAVLITPLIAAANFFLWRQTRDRALLWWAGGAIAVAAGTLVMLTDGEALSTVLIGNVWLILGQWLFYRGVQVFHGVRGAGARRFDHALLAVLLALGLGAIFVDRAWFGHGLAAILIAAIAAGTAHGLVSARTRQARASGLFTGGIFAISALLNGVCGAIALVLGDGAVNWPQVQAVGFVLLIGWSFGFLMLIGQRNQERLSDLADHDELTGANTRRALLEKGRHLFAMAARQGPELGVMMLDIDFFKQVNDAHGHAAGDRVLKNFARIVGECLRGSDVFGRLGGEEFCVLLPDTGVEGTMHVAERIRATFAADEVVYRNKPVSATVSIGVAVCDAETDSLDALIVRADESLYQAKHLGRNRVVCSAADEFAAPFLRLTWDARYRSGNTEIDREHEYLFGWANALLAKMQDNADNRMIEGDVKELLHWLSEHFRHEESILAALHWDGLARHAKLHKALEDRGAVLLSEVQTGTRNFAELLDFVVMDIIARHLARHDTQYFPLTRSQGAQD